jgi:hypothetical protein
VRVSVEQASVAAYLTEIVFIKGIHNTVADQFHGLSMTPVSIEQLRTTLQQKSTKNQKQSETKLDGSLKYNGAS